MIPVIADQLKAFRHQLGKHVVFVGSEAILQPYETTVEQMIDRMVLDWAGDRISAYPPDARPEEARRLFVEAFPDHAARAALLAEKLADLRPGEGHVSLARLIKEGYVPLLFTMCPDDALERALSTHHMVPGEEYHCLVAGKDTPQDIEVAVRESTRFVMVKCGGDIRQRVLPVTADEIRAALDPLAGLIADVFRRMVLMVAYSDRDRPFLSLVPHDGDKIFWVSYHVPVYDPEAVETMRMDSPAAEQFHRYQPEVLELLRARNSHRNLICREQGKFSEFFGRVYERLRRRESSGRRIRPQLSVLRGGPFKFLEAFDVHDADIFFGRETETEKLFELVTAHRVVTLFGRLGVGKTSLVRAGLIPRLKRASEEVSPGDRPWLAAYARCGSRPVAELISALQRSVEQAGYDVSRLASAETLPEVARACLEKTGHRTVFIVDNAQEMFLKLSATAREEFVSQLAELTSADDVDARLLLSVREDYLGELYELMPQLPGVLHNLLRLKKFTREQAEDAIVKPAASFGITFDRELVQQIVEDLDREGILPAHLQIVCHRIMAETRPGRTYIGSGVYQRLGGARKILDDYLPQTLARLGVTDRRLAWRVLRALAEASETIAAMPREELIEQIGASVPAFDRVLARLVDFRLVRVTQRDDQRFIELTHDLLVEDIRRTWAGRGLEPAAQSAHDILARGLDKFRITEQLLDRGEMHAVNDERDSLTLSPTELELLIRSAAWTGIDADYWLGRLGELRERKWQVLADMLNAEDERVRALALKYARDHLGLPLVEPLARLAAGEGEEAQRAVELLRSMERELVAGLASDDSSQRAWAASALAYVNGTRHIRDLVAAIDDRHEEAAEAIAETLAATSPSAAVKALVGRLRSRRPQWTQAEALARLSQDKTVVAGLEKAAKQDPASPFLSYALGLALLRQRRFTEAAEVLERAVRLCEQLGLDASHPRAALDRCRAALRRSQRGENAWPMAGGSPEHSYYLPSTLRPPLEEFWSADLGDTIAGGAVAAVDYVFAATNGGELIALEGATGDVAWRRRLRASVEVTPALTSTGLVVCATSAPNVVAVTVEGDVAVTLPTPASARSPVTTVGTVALFGCRDGSVLAIDLAVPKVIWQYRFQGEVTGAPTAAGGVAVVGSWDATVAAFDLTSGQRIWEYRGDSAVAGSVAVDDGTAFWVHADGQVVAAEVSSGETVWRLPLPSGARSGPALPPGMIVIGGLDGVIRAYSRAGEEQWEFRTDDQILCPPLVLGDVVYAASRDGSLYALELAGGRELWSYRTAYGVYATPAAPGDVLIAVLRRRQVVAFAPASEGDK
ncbi:MAG: PQQ-binding-like beta-propeller repeat protein [Armatimonadetes bacterium]|nr:PQQ-binding-like beta-propeller repeat protein [Armatimonadota bacterium]